MARETGVVKFFAEQRGFGFIMPDNGGPEIFVHSSDLTRGLLRLDPRQHVSYEIAKTDKGNGTKAIKVQLVETSAA